MAAPDTALSQLPDFNRAVISRRRQQPIIGRKCEAVDRVLVPFESQQMSAAAGVIDPHGGIDAAGGKVLAAGGVENSLHELRMAVERGLQVAGWDVPDFDLGVAAA